MACFIVFYQGFGVRQLSGSLCAHLAMAAQFRVRSIDEYQRFFIENCYLCSSVQMRLGTHYIKLAGARGLKIHPSFVMRRSIIFSKLLSLFLSGIIGAVGPL